MVEKMTRWDFVILSHESETFLDSLAGLGVVDIKRSTKPSDKKSSALLSGIEAVKAEIATIRRGSDAHIEELEHELSDLQRSRDSQEVWGDYDIDALEKFDPHFYCAKAKSFDTQWENDYPLTIVKEDNGKVWFVVLGDCDIPLPRIQTPVQTYAQVEAKLEAKSEELDACRRALEARKVEIPALESRMKSMQTELSIALAGESGSSAAEGYLTLFEGYAPSSEDKRLAGEFDAMDGILWFSRPASIEDNPPVKIRNNWFARQFEVLTGMYGMPVYNEFDPTPILAPFFLLFFSMCMGDAGYGLLLIIIAQLLKRMKGGLAGMYRLVRFLGIGTFVIGLLLGTFFGISMYDAAWVPDVLKKCMLVEGNVGKIAGFDPQIVLALGIGVFHICLAMIVKTACVTRQSGFRANLSTWGWTLLVVGGVILAALSLAGLLSPAALKWAVISIAVLSALGIFIFNKPGRNPLLNVGAGLWDSYNMATGLLGDTLSYIRLYALGLAGGMLGGAFNSLASMVLGPNPTWQWLFFIVIVVFGHALNLAMSCLGAFVHPLRLTFVEYFKNSGYDGSGLRYNPLKDNKNN